MLAQSSAQNQMVDIKQNAEFRDLTRWDTAICLQKMPFATTW